MSINAVVLKVASRCNLNCSYCYMYQHADQGYLRQPKLMSDEVFEATLSAMLRHSEAAGPKHRIALTFHGGEPTLIGAERFRRFNLTARERLGDRLMMTTIQTNALLLDERWIEAFKEFDVLVSISLDGAKEIHDAYRVDHEGRGSHERTIRAIRMLQDGGVTPRILSVANPGASGRETYRYFRSLDITRMDFLLPDVTRDIKIMMYGQYGPTPVADFLIEAFDAWMEENDSRVRVRIFYELIRSFYGAGPGSDAFGNPLINYLIVNTDGSIEGMDALRVCGEGLIETGLNVLANDFSDLKNTDSLIHRAVYEGFPLAEECRACPERQACGGGHLPHRYSKQNGFDNPSAWCDDILKLFAHIRRFTGIELKSSRQSYVA